MGFIYFDGQFFENCFFRTMVLSTCVLLRFLLFSSGEKYAAQENIYSTLLKRKYATYTKKTILQDKKTLNFSEFYHVY